MISTIFETYKNSEIPHGSHIQKTASKMSMAKMCHFSYDQHALPQYKYVLCCCDKCPSIVILSQ